MGRLQSVRITSDNEINTINFIRFIILLAAMTDPKHTKSLSKSTAISYVILMISIQNCSVFSSANGATKINSSFYRVTKHREQNEFCQRAVERECFLDKKRIF